MAANETQTAMVGLVLGAVLVVVGIGAYVVTDFAHVTALIPAIFGFVFVALGLVGRNGNRQSVVTYGLGVFALLGVAGSLRGVPDIIALLTGGSVDSVVGPLTQGLMILVSLVVLGVVGRDVLAGR